MVKPLYAVKIAEETHYLIGFSCQADSCMKNIIISAINQSINNLPHGVPLPSDVQMRLAIEKAKKIQ